jgi:RNase P subunit RPR2
MSQDTDNMPTAADLAAAAGLHEHKTRDYTLRAQRAYLKRVLEAKRYSCAECNMVFRGSKELKRHLESRKHVPTVRNPVIHSCHLCNYSTTYKCNLNNHYKSQRHQDALTADEDRRNAASDDQTFAGYDLLGLSGPPTDLIHPQSDVPVSLSA